MKRLLITIIFLAVAVTASAQTTTVTGVVVDPNGNAYFPGTVSAAIILNSGQPIPAGVPASGSIGPFNMTSGGNFSVIVASPFTWAFTICGAPVSVGPRVNPTPTQVCFSTLPIAISGASQVITSNLGTIPNLGPNVNSIPGNAATATALQNAPAQCGVNSLATGITTTGAANCTNSPAVTNFTISGTQTVGNINNVRFIDGTKFAKTAAGINAADTDCGAGTACVIEIPYPGTYSDATIVLTKNHFLRFRSGGTFVHKGIVGPDSNTDTTAVWGVQCPEHATIQLAASSNVDQITTANFLTLSGTNNLFGTYRFTLQGCVLDGNRANQAALVTTGTCTVSNVARTAGGIVTITCSNTPSPAFATGMTVQVGGAGPLANEISNDGYSFNGRFIVQSATATTFTYNQAARNTIASVAATGTTPIAIGYSGSNGVRVYGRNFRIEDNEIGNNVLDGLWNEGGNSTPFSTLNDVLESTFRRNRFANSGGDGWVHWGPQNSKSSDIVTFNHGQWGRELFSPLFDSASVDFLNTSGGTHVVGFGAIQGTNLQPSASSGWGLLLDKGVGINVISAISAGCTPCTGIEVRSPNQQISGTVQNSNPMLVLNGGGGSFTLNVFNNSGNLVNLTAEQGTSAFLIAGDTTSNTGCFSVAPASNDFVSARTTAGTACNVFNIPTSNNQFTIGGWTKTVPVGANSTLADLGVAGTWTAAQTNMPLTTPTLTGVTNGTGLQLFNTTTTCTTAATISTPCTTAAITLPIAYADTNYRLGCSGLTRTNFPQIIDYAKSNTTFTITLNNTTAAAATYASFDCWAVHN